MKNTMANALGRICQLNAVPTTPYSVAPMATATWVLQHLDSVSTDMKGENVGMVSQMRELRLDSIIDIGSSDKSRT